MRPDLPPRRGVTAPPKKPLTNGGESYPPRTLYLIVTDNTPL